MRAALRLVLELGAVVGLVAAPLAFPLAALVVWGGLWLVVRREARS